MVSSDTVVGLVGAGVLLVALVGVFVYESQAGKAETGDLQNALYNAVATGRVVEVAPQGTTDPQTGQCVPSPPQTMCTPARTEVNLEVTGLPTITNVYYVVFLENPGATTGRYYTVGKMDASGNKYAISKTTADNNAQRSRLIVSLETTQAPTEPRLAFITKDGLTQGTAGNSVQETRSVNFMGAAANHTLEFRTASGGTNLTASLNDVPLRSGMEYRGWLVTENETGLFYTFVGNFTYDRGLLGGNTTTDGTISGVVPGLKNDYNRFMVTLESTSAAFNATRPGGPGVAVADYNPPPVAS